MDILLLAKESLKEKQWYHRSSVANEGMVSRNIAKTNEKTMATSSCS